MTSRVVRLISAQQIVEINRAVCEEGGNEHKLYGIGKVESALHSAFYPGDHHFSMVGLPKLPGHWHFI